MVLIDASASMQATDVAPSRLEAARERVRGDGARALRHGPDADRADGRRRHAALDADRRDLRARGRARPGGAPPTPRPTSPGPCASRPTRCAGCPRRRSSWSPTARLGDAADSAGQVHLGDVKLSYVEIGEHAERNAAITGFSVRRYPLDKSRYEVMLEVTNTSDEPMEVELSLLGDGQLNDLDPPPPGRAREAAALLPQPLRRLEDAGGQARPRRRHPRRSAGRRSRLRAAARAAARAGAGGDRRATCSWRRRCSSTSTSTSRRSTPGEVPGQGRVRRHHLRQRGARRRARQRRRALPEPDAGPNVPFEVGKLVETTTTTSSASTSSTPRARCSATRRSRT